MKRFVLLMFVLILAVVPLSMVSAQGGNATTLIRSLDDDIENFNTVTPVLVVTGDTQNYIYAPLFENDPMTGLPVQGKGLTTWEISEDGLIYTFTIRDDAFWSDGVPVSAQDVKFTYDAILRDDVPTPEKGIYERIAAINVIDDKTFEVVTKQVNCGIWGDLNTRPMPAHKFAADGSDFMTNEFNNQPDIASGPYVLEERLPDDYIRLKANPRYWKGVPKIESVILRIMPETPVALQALLAGEIDFNHVVTPIDAEQLEGAQNLTLWTYPTNSVIMLALNNADPSRPMNAYDANGNLVEQPPHPLFGDVRVRRAIAQGYNKEEAAILVGDANRTDTTIPPVLSWAFNSEMALYQYDPDAAGALLDEAGWILNTATGIREKDGKPFEFQIDHLTSTYGPRVGALIQDQLSQIGVKSNLKAADLAAVVGERILPQIYDAFLIDFNALDTPDPHQITSFMLSIKQDVVNGGFNFGSYINPKLDQLIADANTLPGCAPEERAPIYYEIQQIIHDEVPYDFISDQVFVLAINKRVQNTSYGPWNILNDVQNWTLSQ